MTEPDGYAVLQDDPGDTPGGCGFWYVGAYRTEVVANGVAKRNRGSRVVPMFFAPQGYVSSEGKLDKPAQVGNTSFGVGVSERHVIERAQREYDYRQRPEFEAVRISNKALRAFHLEGVLTELVELKGMKDALDDHHAGVKRLDGWADIEADYKQRKPRAWQRARELLQGFPDESTCESSAG